MISSNLNFGVFLFGFLLSNNVIPLNADTILSNIDTLASNICPQTSNPSFCASILENANNIDLKALIAYSLKLAHTNAGKSMTLAKALAVLTTNTLLKKQYLFCFENYDEAMCDIEKAKNDLVFGDYSGVNLAISDAMMIADDCHDSFKQPLKDMSLLPNNTKMLKDIYSIILVISSILPKNI
ncbi:pectinesterase inhibitor-like [Cucumis sativus]|uniref:Pectinesterase inhibitor domain-containing protein n=1 Tax=Cucumis sativus TaxID=3659 RepID=A0A0A0KCC4_CUCSA|nr:pectinesterase inhibitor-like [Cucumis sativus]